MKNKTAIVTGASSGIGLLTALKLAGTHFVIAAVRHPEKAEALKQQITAHNAETSIAVMELDVTKEESVASFSDKLKEYGAVDLLVNNAGTAYGGFTEDLSLSDYRNQYETNVFGLIAVTKAVLPHMKKNAGAKIINVSSISGRIAFPAFSPYASSKHAVEGFSESLRLELRPFGIDVAVVEPGSYRTGIWDTSLTEHVAFPKPDSKYGPYFERISAYIADSRSDYGNPEEVAGLIGSLALKKRLKKLRYPIGKGVRLLIFLHSFLPWRFWERAVSKKLDQKCYLK
ncbi:MULTISPECIES: SDR family oxidoreductase [Bacillus]|uniref:SDR family oxidoreductase n=1 Tax=Bacillus glycinifermentans TaxID=1664069 RepID=A0AAJ3Z1G9_9BACI|nr:MULTISPECIES: SDR family oxidoreductase [Bacillus]KKB74393.1 short-chain dehydrogenase [Bacillus sp. TH008]MDU0072687.1 SDR family oxidoreductase [Bacillus sp. IG6]MED8020481.1 SDR family oxidoreductase [Bacillus glycinifermentans]QAT66888.1 SDR family oxidoreductase [Bacillus glycinifermentans]WKB76590.1 SDR family oxidoreductase [Bacillus glycinifermentans]